MFENIDKSLLAKLVMIHIAIITVSNAIVAHTFMFAGQVISWSAFTFPLVVLATDLTVRLIGKNTARATIAAAYPFAIIASIAIVATGGAPMAMALQIGLASATAYLVSTLLDVYVFQYIRENWTTNWWAAPALSTIVANVIDSYTFFAVAFHNSADKFMQENWMNIAFSQSVLKIVMGLVIFLPIYGMLLSALKKKVYDDQPG